MRFGRRGLRLSRMPVPGASLSGIGAQLKSDPLRFQALFTRQVSELIASGSWLAMATDYRAFPPRKVELDIAFPGIRLGIEVQGGIWMKGGAHSHPKKIEGDIEKQQLALLNGWVVIPVTTRQVSSGVALGVALGVVERILIVRGWQRCERKSQETGSLSLGADTSPSKMATSVPGKQRSITAWRSGRMKKRRTNMGRS